MVVMTTKAMSIVCLPTDVASTMYLMITEILFVVVVPTERLSIVVMATELKPKSTNVVRTSS